MLEHDTDPNERDTDDDGLSDGEEVLDFETDPNEPDSDDDGLSDGEEVLEFDTDPNDPDTDDGGVPDGEEVLDGRDPLDAADDGLGKYTGGGCGCDAAPSAPTGGVMGLLLGLLAVRRRR